MRSIMRCSTRTTEPHCWFRCPLRVLEHSQGTICTNIDTHNACESYVSNRTYIDYLRCVQNYFRCLAFYPPYYLGVKNNCIF